MKKQNRNVFGQNVEVVTSGAESTFSLSKPAENYINLVLYAGVPVPISFSSAYGFTWSREFRKPEIAPSFKGNLSLEMLSSLRQLCALSLDGLSLMQCVDGAFADAVGSAFGAMTHLKSLKLNRVFTTEKTVPTAKVSEVNAAVWNFCNFALVKAVNLVEFESHYNHSSVWSEGSWNGLSSAMSSLSNLKRFSFKETVCDAKTSAFLWRTVANLRSLESCEVKILNAEKTDWKPLIDHLKTHKNLRVLEVGTFDLNNNAQIATLQKIWGASGQLRSFGVKLVNLNTPSVIALFDMLCKEGHENFSQFILEVDSLKELDLIKIHMHRLLEKSNVLDIRIVMDGEEVTPHEIMESCIKKRDEIHTSLEEAIDAEMRALSAPSYEQYISRLGGYPSSVAVLGHQIDAIAGRCTLLMWLDSSKADRFAHYCDSFVLWVQTGKVSHEDMIKKLNEPCDDDDCDLFIRLIPAVIAGCTLEEIKTTLAQSIKNVFHRKCNIFNQRFIPACEDDEKLFNDIRVFEEFINAQKHQILLSPKDRDSLNLILSYLKTLVSKRLDKPVDYFKECVKAQMRDMVNTTDIKLFSSWFGHIFNLMFHEWMGNEESIFKLIMSAINNPELLAEASRVIDLARKPANTNSQVFPSVERKCLVKSLPILLVARRRGYDDQSKSFGAMYNDYFWLTFDEKAGFTREEHNAKLIAEIDGLTRKLFQTEPMITVTKSEEKVEVTLAEAQKKDELPSPQEPRNKETPSRPSLKDQLKKQSPSTVQGRTPLKDLLKARGADSTTQERTPLKDLLKARGSEPVGARVPLKDLLRAKKESAQAPVVALGRSDIHVRANNGKKLVAADEEEFVFTGELLVDFLRHNKDICVLEMGVFDLNKTEELDFIKGLWNDCSMLRSFGLKLHNFNIFSARELLKLLNKKALPHLSQLILNIDRDLKPTEDEKGDLDWFVTQVFETTEVLDIRILSNNVEITPYTATKLSEAKIKASLSTVSSDKGKGEANDCVAIYRQVESKLCEDMSSVSIRDDHLSTCLSISLEIDSTQGNKNHEELNKFITKVLSWLDRKKVSADYILQMIQMPCLANLPDEVFKLISAVIPYCKSKQNERELISIFAHHVGAKFQYFEQRMQDLMRCQGDSSTLTALSREISRFIELINDKSYRVLFTGGHEIYFANVTLQLSAYNDEVFHHLHNKKRFIKECVASQIKGFQSKQDDNAFAVWFSGVAIILFNEKVVDPDYFHDVIRLLLAGINNTEYLAIMSDVIVELGVSQNHLRLSLAILHMAVIKGHEDKTDKFQQRLQEYMRLLDAKAEDTNDVLRDIESYANDIFIAKQVGDRLLFGYIPGKSEAVIFSEEKALGKGDCGFLSMGSSREEVVEVLSLCTKDQSAREQLWEEIFEALETNHLKRTPTFIKLYEAYQDTTITEAEREKRRLKIVKYCREEATVKMYIEAYGKDLWLGYQSALLFAKLSNINLYVWKKYEGSQQLEFTSSTLCANPKRVIHMVFTSKFTHYNLLVEAKVAEARPPERESFDFDGLVIGDNIVEGWEDFRDFGADHQSAEDPWDSSDDGMKTLDPPKPKQKPVTELLKALPSSTSIASNRNRFTLDPIPEANRALPELGPLPENAPGLDDLTDIFDL